MSKFKIYSVNSPDPKVTGRQNKRLFIGYSILFLSTYVTIYSGMLKNEQGVRGVIYYLILAILTIATLYVLYRIWRQVRQLKKIGTLEFTQTNVKKEIGDLKTEFQLNDILRIEAERHLRALTVFQSNTGYISYIIRIVRKDLNEDHLVVSDKSTDFGQKISIISTLNTIKKIADIEVRIINN